MSKERKARASEASPEEREESAAAESGIEAEAVVPEDEVDVSEQDIRETVGSTRKRIFEVAETFRAGRILQEGAVVVITGPTNAGKSSLFNLFLKEDRSIVSEIHGTTRDYIESWIQIDGVPIRLVDTAGMRESDHPVEAEGIRRTREVIRDADVVVFLADASVAWDPSLEEDFGEKDPIRVWHKADIAATETPEGYLAVSSVTGEGFSALETLLRGRITGGATTFLHGMHEVIIDSPRQKDLLDRAVAALDHVLRGIDAGVPLDAVALDLKDALDSLGEVTGEITSSDVLDQIFSSFCVGK